MRDDGTRIECKLKGQFKIHGKKSTNPLAVGDWVTVLEVPGQAEGLITAIKERRNYIIRKSKNLSRFYHVIAANIDQAFLIVTVGQPRTHVAFIDRFLATAEAYHIPASLIFNKIDIYTKEMQDRHNELEEIYRDIGYPCYSISATKGINLDLMRELLTGKVTLFAGHSGVGKSAFIKALQPDLNIRVGAISEYHQSGKHTTTFAEMIETDFGAFIIDTPGLREFGLTDFKKEEVAERFPEFRALMDQCQFNNCTHTHEPKCAVLDALEEGKIHLTRYSSYLGIIMDEDLEEFDYD